MRKTYMKPACEVMYMEATPLMDVSRPDAEKAAGDNTETKVEGLESGGSVVPESSKGGFPWSDNFDLNMD